MIKFIHIHFSSEKTENHLISLDVKQKFKLLRYLTFLLKLQLHVFNESQLLSISVHVKQISYIYIQKSPMEYNRKKMR